MTDAWTIRLLVVTTFAVAAPIMGVAEVLIALVLAMMDGAAVARAPQ